MGWLLCPTAAAFILKNLLPCLGNDTECRMKAYGSRAVNAGKALERKLKGPGSRSGDGEERRKGEGRTQGLLNSGYKWHPTPGLLPGKSHGQRSLVGYSPWGRKESDTTDDFTFRQAF